MTKTQIHLINTIAGTLLLAARFSTQPPKAARTLLRQAKADLATLIDQVINESVQ